MSDMLRALWSPEMLILVVMVVIAVSFLWWVLGW